MDGSRFDTLTRGLTTPGSRRRALGGLLAGAMGLLGARSEETAGKKKPCPPCKKRKKGKCTKKPDGAACAGGTCQSGRCIATAGPPQGPTCIADGIKNGSETDVDCGGSCPRCATGLGCARAADCRSALCINNVCRACDGQQLCPSGCVCLGGGCYQSSGSMQVNNCVANPAECPPNWTCVAFGAPNYYCAPPCGSS